MIVADLDNEVVGMITRHEIAALEPHLQPFPNSRITLYKKTATAGNVANKKNESNVHELNDDIADSLEAGPSGIRRRRANEVPYQELS